MSNTTEQVTNEVKEVVKEVDQAADQDVDTTDSNVRYMGKEFEISQYGLNIFRRRSPT